MLQIASGRLFHGPPGRENPIRGILYSNLWFFGNQRIETSVGALLATHSGRTVGTLILEMVERMEDDRKAPGVLVSRGADYYLDDFSALVSFGLNLLCSPHSDLVERLMRQGRRGKAPANLIKGVFDAQAQRSDADLAEFSAFVDDLVRLPRRQYLAAFRAVQTYQDALHRLGDNREMAYALLVAAVEGLAQKFDGHRSEWADYPDNKRKPIDAALADATEEVAIAVREAVLGNDHLLLSRRFRDFAMAHVEPSFFREAAAGNDNAVSRSDLPVALQQAYTLRSRYLHVGKGLPKLLAWGGGADVMLLERVPILTFQGLSRLVRHVITTFVARQPKLDHEPYDYRREERGIVQVEMASQYWLWNPASVTPTNGRKLLEAFLAEYAKTLVDPVTTLTPLKDTLAATAAIVPGLKLDEKRPYVALYILYHLVIGSIEEPAAHAFTLKYKELLDPPSPESLAAHLIDRQMPDWPIEAHHAAVKAYMKGRKSGLRLPRLFEAAMLLDIAERYRQAKLEVRAKELLAEAVETWPGNAQLLAFEAAWKTDQPIVWEITLLPPWVAPASVELEGGKAIPNPIQGT